MVAGSLAICGSADAAGETTYKKDGNTYTARHAFQSSLPADDLLAICFDFNHLKRFYRESEVKLLKSGTDWQTVEYRTDYKICASTAIYRKTVDRAEHAVRFTMLSHQVSGWGMPAMTASSGSYAITSANDSRSVIYEQSVTLSQAIGVLDWMMIQRKSDAFFADFEAYVRQQEAARAKQAETPGKGGQP